jgi:DNA-binding SARP family transcriptional activator
MNVLQVRLFGQVKVSYDNWLTEVKLTRVVRGLLAYMLLYRHRTHSRDLLAALFWGEQSEEKAHACLNTTLWRLRRILEPDGTPPGKYLVSHHSGEIGFNGQSDYWLDAAILEEQINEILLSPYQSVETSLVEKMEDVLQVYNGELLEGFYDDWALRERERFRILHLNSLAYLMQYKKYQGLYRDGLVYGQQILELDPLREEIQREMIRLLMSSGERAMAIRQYQTYSEMLENELGVEPMGETQALYAQIYSGNETGTSADLSRNTPPIQEILLELSRVNQVVEQLVEQLHKTSLSIKVLQEDIKRKFQ